MTDNLDARLRNGLTALAVYGDADGAPERVRSRLGKRQRRRQRNLVATSVVGVVALFGVVALVGGEGLSTPSSISVSPRVTRPDTSIPRHGAAATGRVTSTTTGPVDDFASPDSPDGGSDSRSIAGAAASQPSPSPSPVTSAGGTGTAPRGSTPSASPRATPTTAPNAAISPTTKPASPPTTKPGSPPTTIPPSPPTTKPPSPPTTKPPSPPTTNPAPPSNTPIPTTHLDAIVDDVGAGLHFVPSTVRAGNVEITLLDHRANPTGTLSLRSFNVQFPIDITGAGSTQMTSVSSVSSYHIVAQLAGSNPPCCVGDTMLPVVPASTPFAQHTHVDVIVDDVFPCNGSSTCKTWGMHFVPADVPVGNVHLTLHDERPNKVGTINVIGGTSQFPIDLTGDGATQETRAQTIQTGIMMSGRLVGANPPCCIANASVSVYASVLATPNDPARTITLAVQPGRIAAPNREVGMIEPKLEYLPIFLPDRPWTSLSIAAGVKTTVIIRNTSGATQKCSIGGVATFQNVQVANNRQTKRDVSLGANSANKYLLRCVGGAQTQEFGMWLVS